MPNKETVKLWGFQKTNTVLLKSHNVNQRFDKHIHDDFGIGVIQKGALGFNYRGKLNVAYEGTINVVNPGEVHNGYEINRKRWSYRSFYFKPKFLKSLLEGATNKAYIPFFFDGVIDDPHFAKELITLHIDSETKNCSPFELESRLVVLMTEFIQRFSDRRIIDNKSLFETKRMNLVIDYINQYYNTELDLNSLAKLVHLTPYHFIRIFSKHTGLTPHAYVKQIRVLKAKKFLESGMTISETALLTGFTDQPHFSNQFKKSTGYTPGKYRNFLQERI